MLKVFKEHSGFKLLLISTLLWALGYGIYKGVIDNYLAEVVMMAETDRGITEFFRELPGLMLVFIIALFYTFSAERFYRMGALIMMVGMGLLSFVSPTKILIILAVTVYSLGEHIQLGMRNTLTINYAQDGKEGRALGYQNSIQMIGTLIGYLVIVAAFLINPNISEYKYFFAVATVFMVLTFVSTLGLKNESQTDKSASRFYFKKKFTKFYMLEMFYGARKQVFFTFGPYVLILQYGASATVISLLFAISSVACFLLSPVVGKIIDKIGYKIVMIMDTIILVVVCFFYGFAHRIFPENIAFIVCCANYVLDSVISLASLASNVYVKDISDNQEEVKATISTGLSINHLVTIFIALFGGWIWKALGIEVLFIVSAVLGLCNSAYAATIKVPAKTKEQQTE